MASIRNTTAAKTGNSYTLTFDYSNNSQTEPWTPVEIVLPRDLQELPADELNDALRDLVLMLARALGHPV